MPKGPSTPRTRPNAYLLNRMRVVVTTETGDIATIEVSASETIESLKALAAIQLSIPLLELTCMFNGRPLSDSSTLADAGIADNDVVLMQRSPASSATPAPPAAAGQMFSADQMANMLASFGGGGAPPPAPAPAAPAAVAGPGASPATSDPAAARRDQMAAAMRSFFQNNPSAPPPSSGSAMALGATTAPPPLPDDGQVRIQVEGQYYTATEFIEYVKASPDFLMRLSSSNPQLAQLVLENQVDEVERFIRSSQAAAKKIRDLEARIAANPFDVEAQRELEEQIRQRNVENNLAQAMEHNPEAFGSVYLLRINCEVNGVPVQALVDSGAQSTIMSEACAERCGIMRLIDTRFAGTAVGVGSAPIAGRVHAAPITIAGKHLTSSFTVLKSDGVDFLLGLDNLRRHECCIDLRADVLRIGDAEVPFLSEADIHALRKDAPNPAIDSGRAAMDTTTTTTTTSTSSATASGSVEISDDAIARVMALGFTREQAVAALQQTGGDEAFAANLLFASQ
ncbi:DNA damage-inducible protein 1, partial [Thecamonas trahens ATCC 50062]